MAIDPRIPLMGQQFNLANIMEQSQAMRMRQMQMEEVQRKRLAEQERASSLSDLIANRGPDGSFDTKGPAFQRFTQAAPEDAFKLLGELGKEERERVKAGLDDVTGALRWVEEDPANGPARWAKVQQTYASAAPEIMGIPYERRHEVLLQTRRMGEYLEKTAPKIMSIEAGGSLAAVDPRTGQPTFTVLPNPGGATPGAPAGPGPRPGQIEDGYRFKGGNPADPNAWEKVGGQTPQASGTFQPVGLAGERITSTRRSAAHNRAVGGVPNSYHLSGRARDSVPPPGMSMSAYTAQLKRLNPHLDVINEGDHVHMEPRG